MRKGLGVILVTLLLIMAVTGCSSKGKKDIKVDKTLEGGISKGRYVEENMVFPEGIDPKEFLSITASPNGDVELYAYNDGSYEKYLYIDEKWNKVEDEALKKFNDVATTGFMIRKVFYGEDKKKYLLGDKLSDFHNALYRLSEADEFEEVKLQRFEDIYEEREVPWRPDIIKVLENGMIAAFYPWRVIEVYSQDGQSTIGEYNCGGSCLMAAEGNILYYADQNDKEIFSINMETKEEGIPRSIELGIFDNPILELDKGIAYVSNKSGIHLNKARSSIWETLIEGNQSSLSMPSETLTDFIFVTEDEYYIVLSNRENRDESIKHIFYDANVSSVPPVELSIFSIDDNQSIRQAINIFRDDHPDVGINFRIANSNKKLEFSYGIKDPKQTITLNDQINALNTEILAGKGPDILVLDDMPIESYIDKGILEDMGSVFTPLKDSGELLHNISDPYFLDGKVYTMPLRFKLPIIYGALDALNASNSVEELAEYARNNKEIPLLGPSSYRALAAWLLMTYYDQILNQENEVDETSLRDFLENINIISDVINASNDAEMVCWGTGSTGTFGYWFDDQPNVYKKEYQTIIEELGEIFPLAIINVVVQKWQGSFRVINNSFRAKGLIGINSAGKQKELAKEFIKLLYSKEIQCYDLKDGFPVNKAAMEEWLQHTKQIGTRVFNTIDVSYPDLNSRKNLYEKICSVDKPMVNDMTMMDMILDEAERYLRGDITAEQAASNAVASINLYLSE